MKKLFLLVLVFSKVCYAQELKFDQNFYTAADKWVAFNKKPTDSTYSFGFIYIDPQAGFTFDLAASFVVTPEGLKKIDRESPNSVKFRLDANTSDVHLLTDQQLAQLGLPAKPEWLRFYKTGEGSIGYLHQMGFHYNHVGGSDYALIPLLKAYEKEPHFKGLEFELGYAYNATRQYEKAREILEKAIAHDPANFWFYRELGFSYKFLKNIEKAESIYKTGISKTDNKAQIAEMAINMTQSYFDLRNKTKFAEWAKIVKDNAESSSPFLKYIQYFEENWDKK
jgi:tetratricopeptide (TPR) repeat protein